MILRYPLLALALLLAAPAALADPCETTDANGANADDILQSTGGQAVLFGTAESGVTQELGQSFTATCDGQLEFIRVLYRAFDTQSAGVVISGNAVLFAGAGTDGDTLETVGFEITLEATMDQRALQVDFSTVDVVEGSVYTLFLDITSGSQKAELFASTNNAYSAGQVYLSNTGDATGAAASDTFDLSFRARFMPAVVNASEEVAQSGAVALEPTRPNPAAGRALVPFTLDRPADVRLAVYDALGREVAVVAEQAYGAGAHAEVLDTSALAPGTYVVRLVAGADVVLRTIAVAR